MLDIEKLFRHGKNKKLMTLFPGEGVRPVQLLRMNKSGPLLDGKEQVVIEGMVMSFNYGVGKEVNLPATAVQRVITGGLFAERALVGAFQTSGVQLSKGFIRGEMTNNLILMGRRFTALRILAGTIPETPQDMYILYDYHPSYMSALNGRLRQVLRFS